MPHHRRSFLIAGGTGLAGPHSTPPAGPAPPPDSDILDYKGDSRNGANTYRTTSGGRSNTTVSVSNPGGWHGYRAWITKANSTDVDIHYHVDDRWTGQRRGANFVNKPMRITVNLRMEGSSGAPGPTADPIYRPRDSSVGRSRI